MAKNTGVDPFRNFLDSEPIPSVQSRKSNQGLCSLSDDLKVIIWDSKMEEITGYSKEEVLGEDLFAEKYAHLFPMKKMFCEAVLNRTALEIEHWSGNREQWFRISLFPVDQFLYITLAEITEEKNRYNELTNIKNLKRHVLNSTADLIWAIDHRYRLLFGNNAYLQMMRTKLGQDIQIGDDVTVQRSNRDLRGERLKIWKEHYDRALKGFYSVATISISEEAVKSLHEVTFQPVESSNSKEIVGVTCFSRNVSERAQHIESIEKQNSQLREIAWLQSHKMRAPLSNILGLTDLILNSSDWKEKLQLIELLQESAFELDEIVKEVAQKTTRA